MLLHHCVQHFLSLMKISGFWPEPFKINSMAFPWKAMKTCSNSEWRLMYLQAGRILKRFVSAPTAAFFIASCCFIHLHIFGSSSLKLEHFSTSLAGVIPPSRSRITCALNLAGYERHLFFKWRYLFFLTPAFYFPELSNENVFIDGPSNSSPLVTLTATVLEDSWPGWLITTLCLHFICVDKASTFPDLSLQNLQAKGFSSQTTLDILTSPAFPSFFVTIFAKPDALCTKQGLFWHFSTNLKQKADQGTPALNLQIIFCKLASSAMQCLLTSKLSNEKVDECHVTWEQTMY